jgi:hypothetical protein
MQAIRKPNMLSRGMIVCLFIMTAAVAAAEPEPKPPAPQQVTLTLPAPNPLSHGKTDFFGEILASGVLQIYWTPAYPRDDGVRRKTLQMRFLLDAKTLARLPSIQVMGEEPFQPKWLDVRPLDIQWYYDIGFDEEAIKARLQGIGNIPENFFKYRERVIIFPATLRLTDWSLESYCESHFFHAALVAIEHMPDRLPEQELEPRIPDDTCDGDGFDDFLVVFAKVGDQVEIRASPDPASRVVERLDEGFMALKLKTINEDWLYIRAFDTIYGYIHTPGLRLESGN